MNTLPKNPCPNQWLSKSETLAPRIWNARPLQVTFKMLGEAQLALERLNAHANIKQHQIQRRITPQNAGCVLSAECHFVKENSNVAVSKYDPSAWGACFPLGGFSTWTPHSQLAHEHQIMISFWKCLISIKSTRLLGLINFWFLLEIAHFLFDLFFCLLTHHCKCPLA